ncbi:MAG: TRAP transporter small permease subunit [Proteobacteria bacterium]|nr:TRAP transporter small permease subunit [Pseudomonadota bacterium]
MSDEAKKSAQPSAQTLPTGRDARDANGADDTASPAAATNPDDVDLDRFARRAQLPHTRLSLLFDSVLRRVGDLVSWVWVVLVAVIMVNVTMRYVFQEGRIEFEEIQWHLYSIGFLIGLSYAFEADDHVRVDLLHDNMSLRTQAWIELYGILLLLLPFLAVVLIYSVPFISNALVTGERSQAPGGLGYYFIIKSFLFAGFALMVLAGLSRLSRVCSLLFGAPRPIEAPGAEEE